MNDTVDDFAGLIALWPTIKDLARDLAVPYPTVNAWVQRNSIPSSRWASMIASAKRFGIKGVTLELMAKLVKSK